MRWIFGPLSLVIVLGSIVPTARADFIFAHADHTYRLVATPTPWAAAAAAAGTLAVGGQTGYLAHIEDAAENAAIASQLLAGIPAADFTLTRAPDGGMGAAYVWLGAQDLTVEGTWIWDGDFNGVGPLIGTGMGLGGTWVTAPGTYHNWGTIAGNQREPDNGGNNQDSAGISLNGWPFGTAGQWNDVRSTDTLYYLVEFNAAVPEPSSGVLFVGGLLFLAASLRWRAGATRKSRASEVQA